MINLLWQPGMTMDEIEKVAITQAVAYYKGNKTQAARSLGLSIRTVDAKLEKYGADEASLEKIKKERAFENENNLRRARGLKPIPEMPEETEDEIQIRLQAEEKVKRDNFLKRQRGEQPLDPNALEAQRRRVEEESRLRTDRDRERTGLKTRKEDGKASSPSSASAEAGTNVQSGKGASAEHEMPVPFRKEVQGVSPKPNAGTGSDRRR